MQTTDAQVRKLMEEKRKQGKLGVAALRSGMSRRTAAKYEKLGKLPSELKRDRHWRTRLDPFTEDWDELAARLKDAPELEARTLFEDLLGRYPEKYHPGQLRTLQRRIKQWRAQEGPPKRVFFAQEHRAGEAMQTDFFWGTSLSVTIGGAAFPHLMCHPVLPYSNWEWVTLCQSESMAALKRGVQAAVFRLGRVPQFHQTDNSSAATHDLRTGKRGFNQDYLALMGHLGMTPRTIEIGESEQNGDVEALNGVLRRRLEQHLLMRGHRDFESVEIYEKWVQAVAEQANRLREKRLRDELEAMSLLKVDRFPEYSESEVRVTSWSTIRIKHNAYSVPSTLKGERVRVRVYDDRLEVRHGGKELLSIERLTGRNGHRINYRHIIWSLVQKPGAFERYRYRDDLFPTPVFRRGYDFLRERLTQREADIEYLRVLHLAASTMQSDVEAALELLMDSGQTPLSRAVRSLSSPEQPSVPELAQPEVHLDEYDTLLETENEVAQ